MRKKVLTTFVTTVLAIVTFTGVITHNPPAESSIMEIPAVLPDLPTTTLRITEPVDATKLVPAVRVNQVEIEALATTTTSTTLPAPPTGLWGAPFAPEGLSDCDEFKFYREQWGLPARFDALAWRESNCRNEDGVKTFCCYGYLQLWVDYQITDYRVTDRFHECGVYSHFDVNSDTPIEKQKQLCAAAVIFSISGYGAWAT